GDAPGVPEPRRLSRALRASGGGRTDEGAHRRCRRARRARARAGTPQRAGGRQLAAHRPRAAARHAGVDRQGRDHRQGISEPARRARQPRRAGRAALRRRAGCRGDLLQVSSIGPDSEEGASPIMIPPHLRLAPRLALLFLLVAGLAACDVNAVPRQDEAVKAAWSQVLNQYQRRSDLIPNLVETVKGYAHQEQQVLTQVTEARAKATRM